VAFLIFSAPVKRPPAGIPTFNKTQIHKQTKTNEIRGTVLKD
jgi:hypothetical protein